VEGSQPNTGPKPGVEPADEVVPTRGPDPDPPEEAPADEPASEAALVEEEQEDEHPLAKAERERDEYLDLAQRTRAELDNFRKRAARDSAQAGERAKANLVRELLPVVDNLERALGSAGEGEQHLAEGVRMVHGQLVAALEREGIQQFDPAGDAFDPECHEALSTREQEGSDSGLVLDVVEKGYRLNGTVLRPARVVVSA
jgi:molecular chaperone GrpE